MRCLFTVLTGALLMAASAPALGKATGGPRLLIAPHIAGETYCPSVVNEGTIDDEEAAAFACAARNENAAARITTLLDSIGPSISPSGHYALGYTLNLPLMRFYTKSDAGWTLDRKAIATWVRTIHDVDRPVVVYLSANHFTDGGIAVSKELARDTANLMWTKAGPLAPESYFVVSLYAWTLSNPAAAITVMRRNAFKAVMDEICRLDPVSRARIRGLSVLGEVHQLYSNFLSGQGYNAGFDVTDYEPSSVAAFQKFLAAKFGTVQALNQMAGSSFANFDAIKPPAKNIRHDHLNNFFEHIDEYAAGTVAVQGWAVDKSGKPVQLAIYLDGKFRANVTANLNRTDVPEADPSVRTPNVGWRYDLDYRGEEPGIHTLEVFITQPGKRLVRVTSRGLTVVARNQRPSMALPSAPVDADAPDPASPIRAYIDGPAPLVALFYNPIAALWLEYRNIEVANYIKGFARIADQSCLPGGMVFSHQLMPELNSSWNKDLMAVDASQVPNPDYNQGTTLYGGAAWGQAFFDWKNAAGWKDYAVSEMHPRTELTQAQFEAMLDAHRVNGAVFVAPYYLTIVPWAIRKSQTGGLGTMAISPENHQIGSDGFYRAISDIMRNH